MDNQYTNNGKTITNGTGHVDASVPSVYNIPAYVITMDDRRYNIFERAFKNSSIKPIIFDAINGKEIKDQLLNKPYMLSPMAQRDIQVRKIRGSHDALAGWGTVGCYMSHVELWKQARDSKNGIFIFEDDAAINKKLYKNSKLAEKEIKRNFDFQLNTLMKDFNAMKGHLLYLTRKPSEKRKNIPGINTMQEVEGRVYGMWAYYVSPEGARILLKYAFPIEQQVDSYLGTIISMGKKNTADLTRYENFSAYMSTIPFFMHTSNYKTSTQTKGMKHREEMLQAAHKGFVGQEIILLVFYITSILVLMRLYYYSIKVSKLPPVILKEMKMYVVFLTALVVFYTCYIRAKVENISITKQKLAWF